MATMNKPSASNVEWVPIVFVVAACYIVTLLFVIKNVDVSAMQIAGGIATTFGGAAAGAYGSKLVQNRGNQTRATDAPNGAPPDPTQPQG